MAGFKRHTSTHNFDFFIILSSLLMLSSQALALQQQVTREALCGVSSVVLVAEVTSIETRWSEGETGGIERVAWLAPVQNAVGELSPQKPVLLPGGELNGLTYWVEDVPKLETDQQYLLFLKDRGGFYEAIGGDAAPIPIQSTPGTRGQPITQALNELGGCLNGK
jgi:hypothetical protein